MGGAPLENNNSLSYASMNTSCNKSNKTSENASGKIILLARIAIDFKIGFSTSSKKLNSPKNSRIFRLNDPLLKIVI